MSWYAKPSGGYAIGSTEGTANILEIAALYQVRSYRDEAIAGICGNVAAESALNPWRWQSDVVNLSNGYGLFQFTPASGYMGVSVAGKAPNMSTSIQTAGALPSDGAAQVTVQADDLLSKWVSTCWRSYWSPSSYPSLYSLRTHILNTYGNGSTLTLAQFSQITDVQSATFAFLACFEGPAVPNLNARVSYANQALAIIQGAPPTPPTPPNFPLWLLFKIRWR